MNVRKIPFLFTTLMLLGTLTAVALVISYWERRKPPSIVLIIIDTLRYDSLGINGSGNSASVELDQLASRGVVFDKAISQASWTRSSMASMITGLYPRRVNVVKEQWDALPEEAHTLAEFFKANGYATIGITANPQLNRDFQFQQGFDFYQECEAIFPWMRLTAGKTYELRSVDAILATSNLRVAYNEIKSRSQNSPVFVQALLMDVHEYLRIRDEEISPQLKGLQDAKYLESVRRVTQAIAAFIGQVDTLLNGDVVFIITSDHGQGLSDHPSIHTGWGHGNLLYRSSIHVPLLFLEGSNRSEFVAGRREQLTEMIDLAPTLLDIAKISWDPAQLDGRSLLLSLKGGKTLEPRNFAHSETQWRPGVSAQAILADDWLYVARQDSWPGTDPEELQFFTKKSDGRLTNVAIANPETTQKLKSDLKSFEESSYQEHFSLPRVSLEVGQ